MLTAATTAGTISARLQGYQEVPLTLVLGLTTTASALHGMLSWDVTDRCLPCIGVPRLAAAPAGQRDDPPGQPCAAGAAGRQRALAGPALQVRIGAGFALWGLSVGLLCQHVLPLPGLLLISLQTSCLGTSAPLKPNPRPAWAIPFPACPACFLMCSQAIVSQLTDSFLNHHYSTGCISQGLRVSWHSRHSGAGAGT